MKLEDYLSEQEMSKEDMVKFIKEKLPKAKNIKQDKSIDKVTFTYDDYNFFMSEKDGQKAVMPEFSRLPKDRAGHGEVWNEIRNKLK